MSETAHSPEPASSHETTAASNSWLKNAREKVGKFLGSAALTTAGEFFTNIGAATASMGFIFSVMTGNPLPTLLGAIPSAIGGVIGWQGVKESPSKLEKATFLASKAAVTVAPLAGVPLDGKYILSGLSLASTAFGMRHRK